MARGFRQVGGVYEAHLEQHERDVVITLVEQTLEVVAVPAPPEDADPFEAIMRQSGLQDLCDEGPEDPALGRLMPDAHHEDPLTSIEFRRLTGHSIRERKAAKLQATVQAFTSAPEDIVRLSPEVAEDVLVAFTDVRLVMGERLGLRTERDAEELERRLDEAASENPSGDNATFITMMLFYDFLTWLQETLASSLLESRRDDPGKDDDDISG